MSGLEGVTVFKDSLSEEASKTSNTSNQSHSQMGEFSIGSSSSVWEIEEECFEVSAIDDDLFRDGPNSNNGVRSLKSIKEEFGGTFDHDDDVVYVGIGKSNSSMDALVWSINQININSSKSSIFLVHVFPEIRFVPTPLGKLPISQVNPQQLQTYLNQEKSKRRDFLHKFLDVCSASKVKVDTILIESDMEAKALLDLIPILNISKLVLGTTKSSLRKMRSKKGNGIVDQVVENAPEFCEVKIICDGAVVDTMPESLSSSPSPSPRENVAQTLHEEQNTNSFGCTCFKSKAIE